MNRIMKKTTSRKSCFDEALHLLSYRSHSRMELTRKLRRRGYEEKEIEQAIDKAAHYGYINDEELASDVFDHYARAHAYGDLYIHQKLASKGLSCEKHLSREEELENAENLLNAKERISPGIKKNRRKVAGFLSRRGFSTTTIHMVLESLPADEEWSRW
jgi:regulatory protein